MRQDIVIESLFHGFDTKFTLVQENECM